MEGVFCYEKRFKLAFSKIIMKNQIVKLIFEE